MRTPPDVQASGQYAFCLHATLNATLHDIPDVKDSFTHACRCFHALLQHAFVGKHQLPDCEVVIFGHLQQFVRAGKGKGHGNF